MQVEKLTKESLFLAENLGINAFLVLSGGFAGETLLIPECHKPSHPIKNAFLFFGLGVSPFMTLCDLYGGKKLEIKPLTTYEQLRAASFLISPQNESIPVCKNAVMAIKKTGITSRSIRAKKRIKRPILSTEELNHLIKFSN